MSKFAVFRYKRDKRFMQGYNPRSFKYVSTFYDSYWEAHKDCSSRQGSEFIYGIETITRY